MADRVVALDIGGTKIAAALMEAGSVVDRREVQTQVSMGVDAWMDAVADCARPWRGRYEAVGAAVTGLVDGGIWSAPNPQTLAVPAGFPIEAELSARLGAPARAWNDAQAAAWGEYRRGAGRGIGGRTMVFVTVSTGVGGGIVAGGRLLGGLAGHFGQWRLGDETGGPPAEAAISGRWIAAKAQAAGRPADSRAVFDAWRQGEGWAAEIVGASVRRAAALLLNIHLALDPAPIVVGGGVGLAPGYLEAVGAEHGVLPPRLRPRLTPALLGADAGLVGAAELVSEVFPSALERI